MGDYWYWPIWKNPYRSTQLKTTYSDTRSLFSVLGHQQRLPQNSPSHVHPHYLVQLGALAYLFIILINNSKYRLNTKQPFFLISRLSFEATLVPSFIFFLSFSRLSSTQLDLARLSVTQLNSAQLRSTQLDSAQLSLTQLNLA